MLLMRNHVAPHDIVRRILGNSTRTIQDGTLGEYKEVITSMVITDIQETVMYTTVKRNCSMDVLLLVNEKGKVMRKGKRYDEKQAKTLYNQQSLLSITNNNKDKQLLEWEKEEGGSVSVAMTRQLPEIPKPLPVPPHTPPWTLQSLNQHGRKHVIEQYKVCICYITIVLVSIYIETCAMGNGTNQTSICISTLL